MAEEKREVNFSESVNLSNDEEETEKIEEEKETLPESSQGENEEEEKETPEGEQKPEGKSEELPKPEPKPVEGETPRERALRLEVQRVKDILRKERSKKLFEGDKLPSIEPTLTPEEQELLKQYNPDEVNTLEKIIDVIGKKKGWVKKDEYRTANYQQQSQEVLDEWLENHSEYLSENDKDNILWDRFQEELAFYKKPENPKLFKKLFDKVHRDVFEISSGKTDDSKVNAQREKLKVASHSGAAPTSPKIVRRESQLDPSLGQHLKGFSEDEKKEIFGE